MSPHGGRSKGALWALIRALVPLMRASPSWPNHLPKAPHPNTIAMGVRISDIRILGTHKHCAQAYSLTWVQLPVILTKAPDMRVKPFWTFQTGQSANHTLPSGQSMPHGTEGVPRQALTTFLTHKIVRVVKVVVLLSQWVLHGSLGRNQ